MYTYELPRSILPPVGTGHFRLVPAPVPANFVNFRSVPAGSGRILATGFRHVPYRRRSGEIPTESVSEVVGTSPAKTVPESGPMETVGTRRTRPSLIGTGRNYPTGTGSESVCKEPVGSGRFRPSRNDLGDGHRWRFSMLTIHKKQLLWKCFFISLSIMKLGTISKVNK